MGAGVHTILGSRGSGKSRLARALCRASQRLIVLDTLAEHSVNGYAEEVTLEDMAYLVKHGKAYRVGVVPDSIEYVGWICDWAAARRGLTLFIDEIDYWYPQSTNLPCKGILDLARYGRHYAQTLVVVARQPAAVHPSYRGEGCLWIFPMRGRGARAYVRDVAGGFDPYALKVLDMEGEHILRSQVACVDGTTLKAYIFDLVSGELSIDKE